MTSISIGDDNLRNILAVTHAVRKSLVKTHKISARHLLKDTLSLNDIEV